MEKEVLQALDPTGAVASHRTLNTGKRSFDALTGMRFFAAISVVLYHFADDPLHHWPSPIFNLVKSGLVAVSFFYVLSGFVLSYSYVGARSVMQGSRRSFWVARLARIYPAYFLAFLLAAPTNIVWSLQVNSLRLGLLKLFSGAIPVLTLQQAWTPWTAWYWNYPGWSVSVEAFFYLLFPFLVPMVVKIPRSLLIPAMAALWLTGLVIPVLATVSGHTGNGGLDRAAMAVEFTPLLRVPEFIVGILLARLYVDGFRWNNRTNSICTYGSLAAILLVLSYAGLTIPRLILSNGLLVPLFALLILCLAEGKTVLAKALSWSPLILLGEASYGMYILQIPVSYVLRSPPPYNTLGPVFGFLLVLVIVSMLSWRFVEAPLRVQIRRRLLALEMPRFIRRGSDTREPEWTAPQPEPTKN